jgi:ubiquinone/menaquinone biosynthesis C-methylase UbiE
MNAQSFCSQYLRCPSCHSQLSNEKCTICGEIFPNTLGILDLRWPRPSGRDFREEQLIALILEQYEFSTFIDLSELVRRHHLCDFSEDLQEHLRSRSSNREQLGRKMMDMFQHKLSKCYTIPGKFLALDVGCGYGTASTSLAPRFNWVVGLDPYLPVLLLAKKSLEERKIQNVILIQAYAQNIPLHNEHVDYAVAQNVIEHLINVKPALYETRRVLKTGGCFCGDSRNRFDLFFPEPHVKLRWVGLIPRKLQSWYVRKFKHVSYADVHAHLLSWWELRRYAREVFGRSVRVVLPLVSAYGQSPYWDKWIERIEAVPILRDLTLLFFPSHLLLAQSNEPLNEVYPVGKVQDIDR